MGIKKKSIGICFIDILSIKIKITRNIVTSHKVFKKSKYTTLTPSVKKGYNPVKYITTHLPTHNKQHNL